MESQTSKMVNPPDKLRAVIVAVLIFLFIILIIGLGWIYLDNFQAAQSLEVGSSLGTETALQAQILQQDADIADKSSRLEEAAATINNLNSALTTLTTQTNDALATQTSQKNTNGLLAASNESYKTIYQEYQAQINQIQAELMCDNSSSFKADYGSNYTLSNSLKKFIGDIGGNFAYASWDFLWPNSKNAVHRITVHQDGRSFTNIFIAYFDEKDFSKKGVFWVNRACWLDK